MGMMDMIKDAADTNRKIELQHPMEVEELFRVLSEEINEDDIGKPQFKKGLMGKSVVFPKVSRVTPKITVKGNIVHIAKITDNSSTNLSIGGVSIPLDEDRRGKNSVNTIMSGSSYFKAVAAAVEAVLADK